MAYRLQFAHTSHSGRTTAHWVEDSPAIRPRDRRPAIGVSLPSAAEVEEWAAERGLPWEPPTGRRWDGDEVGETEPSTR